MWRDPAYLLDMLQACRRALGYSRDLDEPAFMSSDLHQDAILRQLTVVGEATKRVSDQFRASHPEIPWRKIAGFRDVVVHEYSHVDLDEVWRIVREDLPELLAALEPLVPPES